MRLLAGLLTIAFLTATPQVAPAKGRAFRRVQRFIKRTKGLSTEQKHQLIAMLKPQFADPATAPKVTFKRNIFGVAKSMTIGAKGKWIQPSSAQSTDASFAKFTGAVRAGSKDSSGWTQPIGFSGGTETWDGSKNSYLTNRLRLAVSRGNPDRVSTLKGVASGLALINGVTSHMDKSPLLGQITINRGNASQVLTGANGKAAIDGKPAATITTVLRWRSAANMPALAAQDMVSSNKTGAVLLETGFSDGKTLRMFDGQKLKVESAPAE